MDTKIQKSIAIVVAVESNFGIGAKGTLPWKIPQDMAFFKNLTTQSAEGKMNAVIMGRKTFESIPPKFRPLAGRLNIVLSRTKRSENQENPFFCTSFEEALERASLGQNIDKIFVIGGQEVYKEALQHPTCKKIYLTRILKSFPECDTFLPNFGEFDLEKQSNIQSHQGIDFQFEEYQRVEKL